MDNQDNQDNQDKWAIPSEPRPLNLERFRAIVEAYGAAAERWPEAERAAAIALLAGSPEARGPRDQAAWLDGALQQASPSPPSDDLVEGLRRLNLADAQVAPELAGQRGVARHARRFNLTPLLSRPVAWAAVAVIAFAVGLILPSPFGEEGRLPSEPQAGTTTAATATTDELDGARAAALPLVDGWPDDPSRAESSVVEIASVDIVDTTVDSAFTTAQALLDMPLD